MNGNNFLKNSMILLITGAVFCVLFPSRAAAGKLGVSENERSSLGPDIIFDSHPASKVVCIAVSVGSGSVYEKPHIRGISHFIEHMVFNGSERFTREEISDWVDDTGAFLNAFTRKERTIYFMLVRRDLAEEGVEILSQMLLRSVFPREELEKERKIVLEEITKTLDNPGQARRRYIDNYLFRGSRFTDPVLGYPSTVKEITRDQLISYYRRFYKPSNMKIFVMGGFDRVSLQNIIKDYFRFSLSGCENEYEDKCLRGGNSRSHSRPFVSSSPDIPRWSNEITTRYCNSVTPGFDMLVRIPGDVEAQDLALSTIMEDILASENSPLREKFEAAGIKFPRVSLEIYSGFSALRFHFPSIKGGSDDCLKIPEILGELAHWEPGRREVDSSCISYLSSNAFDREKFHYYIMLHGETMSLLGESYLNSFIEEIKEIDREDIEKLLGKTFDDIEYNACLVRKGERRFKELTTPEKTIVKKLPNGCVVSASQREDSEIAALNILIKHRNCLDALLIPGSSTVLHGILEMSEYASELSQKLESLGARVEWGDNPYIPMDDYRLNPSFSFIRLEAPGANFREAAGLLVDYIREPGFKLADISRSQRRLMRDISVRRQGALFKLERRFYKKLFGEHPFGNSIFPGPQYWEKITVESLDSYSKKYFTGRNIIASVVSGDLPSKSGEFLSKLFSLFSAGKIKPEKDGAKDPLRILSSDSICESFPGKWPKGRFEFPSPGSGAYLMAGFASPAGDSDKMAAILVTSEILSSRMQDEIREGLGLAYSTGCRTKFMKGGAVTSAYLGTRAKNMEKSREALKGQIEKLGQEKPDKDEVTEAINRIISRMERRRLSSINQAFYSGKNLFLSGNIRLEEEIIRVDLESVNMIIDKYLGVDNMLYIDFVPRPAKEGERQIYENAPNH
ncbi:MAG: insulinase family protein [Candidatus Krumholzibacteriota bacterium]|nr:insulinase family protein [Candidatus Krumholzibacteriota bacterium]